MYVGQMVFEYNPTQTHAESVGNEKSGSVWMNGAAVGKMRTNFDIFVVGLKKICVENI